MPLWILFVLAFLLIAGVSIGSVWYFLVAVIGPLVSSSAFGTVAIYAGVCTFLTLLCVGLVFSALGKSISRPLRRLSEAVEEFTANGKVPTIDVSSLASGEMHSLVASSVAMMERVEAAHERDEEVSRVKSDFISTAAHQFRTPLTGIRWALEALQKSSPTAEQVPVINDAVAKSKELVAIVGTLLDISAIEAGKYVYQFAPIDVNALLSEVSADFSLLAQKRAVTLITVNQGEVLPPARADRERIKWVVNNLVENALHYTPGGGTVRLTAELGAQNVLVRVHDTGIGILPKDQEHIFERFFRAGNAASKENEGNGLGLYIARTIARDHGGDLEFRANDDGPGTTFTLTLPIAES